MHGSSHLDGNPISGRAASRLWRTGWTPKTLSAIVDGADLCGCGSALASVLGEELLHPRNTGAQAFQRSQFDCGRAG
jgi:hypothetical protein